MNKFHQFNIFKNFVLNCDMNLLLGTENEAFYQQSCHQSVPFCFVFSPYNMMNDFIFPRGFIIVCV